MIVHRLVAALFAGLAIPSLASAADRPLQVVASFSVIADFAHQVGGDRIAVTTIVGPDGDAHVYEPKPADAAAVARADVVLVNGLHFEGFLDRLVESSGTKAKIAVLTEGVTTIEGPAEEEEAGASPAETGHDHAHGGVDPHAFQSIANARIYVANIVKAFCASDAAGCDAYKANAARYDAELVRTEAFVRDGISRIPQDKRRIITSHDAFGYFAKAYGVTFIAPEGISTESEASAADVAAIVRQVADQKATALFVENITDPRLIEQIASETGLRVGGSLFSDALSGPDGPASTYIDMMHHNVDTIRGAILGS